MHGIPAGGRYEYSIGSNDSETSLQDAKFRGLDESLGARKTISGPCGLFRGVAFWKPNRRIVSARDCYNNPGTPSEKVWRTHRKILLGLIIVTSSTGTFLSLEVMVLVRIFSVKSSYTECLLFVI